MLLAHKIELRPAIDQIEYINQACGCRRHCYNQLLDHFSNPENKWSKKSAYQHYIKVIRLEFPFYNEVSSRVTRNAIDDLDNAFQHFFRRVKLGQKAGFPQFKKKDVHDSFAMREKTKFNVSGRLLRIEKLKTKIKLRQPLRFDGVNKQVTISKRAGKFYASILVETNEYNPKDVNRSHSVGVDLGIKNLAVCSDGKIFPPNQKLKANMKKLAKLQKKLAKKNKGSHRRAKAKLKVAKLHFRIAKQRQEQLHIVSDYLTAHFNVITIEDLAVSNMLKNHKLARAIADSSWSMLRQQIEYKAKLRDCTIIIADRFFPSSKKCFDCGAINKNLMLSDRQFICDCGNDRDRDDNASLNLNKYGVDTLQPTTKRT
jgi:putative transposase